jgi:hypothetical protein
MSAFALIFLHQKKFKPTIKHKKTLRKTLYKKTGVKCW